MSCRRCGELTPWQPFHEWRHRIANATIQRFSDWLVGAP